MTVRPALVSSRARMLPVQPMPTMTASTSFNRTPRQFFAAGVVATNACTRKVYGKDFDRLAATEREDELRALEQGKPALVDFDGKAFFEALLQITMEGFFADPIYGGNRNRNKASWRMIGFPGLPAVYSKL